MQLRCPWQVIISVAVSVAGSEDAIVHYICSSQCWKKFCKAVVAVLESALVYIALASAVKNLAFGGSDMPFISLRNVLESLI